MIRAFVAVDIENKNLLAKLLEIQRMLKRTNASMKLVEPENIHITLYFLGNISEADIPRIESILKKCTDSIKGFDVHLLGVGAFPKASRPRVVWVGIQEGGDILKDIANCLKKEFIRAGFRREDKDFHPHVTLARIKFYNNALIRLIESLKNLELGIIHVDSIKLKKSTLTSRGPIYEDLVTVSLNRSSESE